MRFLRTFGAAFIGGLKFEIKSFDQPSSCMRCITQETSRLHARLMQLSQRRGSFQRLKRRTARLDGEGLKMCRGSIVFEFISCPEPSRPPKETELCTLMYKSTKTCALLRTRSLFRFHACVRLGGSENSFSLPPSSTRPKAWVRNFVCFLQCS